MLTTENYFARDCLRIVEKAQVSPDTVADVGCFVLLTIQQWLALVPRAMEDVRKNGVDSRFAWGNKKAGVAYVIANKTELHHCAVETYHGRMTLDSLILHYLAIPGLGITKAQFLAQMTVGDGACLDMHNLRELGLSEAAFKTPKTLKVASIMKRIETYNAIWRAGNRDSAYWWNHWCNSYAIRKQAKSPIKYANGSEVSRVHLCAIGEYSA